MFVASLMLSSRLFSFAGDAMIYFLQRFLSFIVSGLKEGKKKHTQRNSFLQTKQHFLRARSLARTSITNRFIRGDRKIVSPPPNELDAHARAAARPAGPGGRLEGGPAFVLPTEWLHRNVFCDFFAIFCARFKFFY